MRRYLGLLVHRLWTDTRVDLQIHRKTVIVGSMALAVSMWLITRVMGERAAIEQFETALIGIVSPFVVVLLFNAVRSPYRIWEEQESAVRKLSVEFAEYRTASMSQLAELRSQISALSSTQWDGLRERFEKFVSHDDRFYVIFEADSCYMRGDDMPTQLQLEAAVRSAGVALIGETDDSRDPLFVWFDHMRQSAADDLRTGNRPVFFTVMFDPVLDDPAEKMRTLGQLDHPVSHSIEACSRLAAQRPKG